MLFRRKTFLERFLNKKFKNQFWGFSLYQRRQRKLQSQYIDLQKRKKQKAQEKLNLKIKDKQKQQKLKIKQKKLEKKQQIQQKRLAKIEKSRKIHIEKDLLLREKNLAEKRRKKTILTQNLLLREKELAEKKFSSNLATPKQTPKNLQAEINKETEAETIILKHNFQEQKIFPPLSEIEKDTNATYLTKDTSISYQALKQEEINANDLQNEEQISPSIIQNDSNIILENNQKNTSETELSDTLNQLPQINNTLSLAEKNQLYEQNNLKNLKNLSHSNDQSSHIKTAYEINDYAPNNYGNMSKKSCFSFKFIIKTLFLMSVIICVISFFTIIYFSLALPVIPEYKEFFNNKNTVKILSSDQKLINYYGSNQLEIIEYENISPHLVHAVLATEDREFFQHNGIKFTSLSRAFIKNLRKGLVIEGGSTITQQLAKISFLSSERTIKRKIQEILLSFAIENKFTKKEIFSIYINSTYFGNGNYGIADASRIYFNKNAKDLDIIESAMLAGLLKAPSKYAPTNNKKLSVNRTAQIIINMHNANYIDKKQLLQFSTNLDDKLQKRLKNRSKNIYFSTDWIHSQLDYYLDLPKKGTYNIHSTINKKLQNIIDTEIRTIYNTYKTKLAKSEIALVAMKPTGEILAIIGGHNYIKSQYNRALFSHRQPGSIFKLFVYIKAIESGYKPSDIFIDEPVIVDNWHPQNYNNKYYNEVTMREAFTRSLNSIAIKLGQEVGIEHIITLAKKLGINSKLNRHPSLVLGTNEVTLFEIVTAYAHIANNGYPVIPYIIKEISNQNQEILYKRMISEKNPILNQQTINYTKDLLYNVTEWGTGRNAKIKDKKIYAKTGTTQNYRDAWFIGFSDDIIMGIWIGNDDNSKTNKITGGSIPAKLWKNIIKKTYEKQLF